MSRSGHALPDCLKYIIIVYSHIFSSCYIQARCTMRQKNCSFHFLCEILYLPCRSGAIKALTQVQYKIRDIVSYRHKIVPCTLLGIVPGTSHTRVTDLNLYSLYNCISYPIAATYGGEKHTMKIGSPYNRASFWKAIDKLCEDLLCCGNFFTSQPLKEPCPRCARKGKI